MPSAADQYEAAKETPLHIADRIEAGWDVAIGHGNGPPVGFILRQSEVTQVLVEESDPAFRNPSKPIGGFMTRAEAEQKEKALDWDVIEDAGRGWRRVVASPLPKEVVELDTVKTRSE